jgi:shikimate dehydrogenase
MYKLGLIGNPVSHSFSKEYFDAKFKKEDISNFSYSLHRIKDLKDFPKLIKDENLIGLNITRPHKTNVIEYLDEIDEKAKITNSVNTVFIHPKTKKKVGFNTDIMGFSQTIKDINTPNIKGLILGSGSVAKTISYCLNKKQINHLIVSRNPRNHMIGYRDIKNIIDKHQLIINTTPLGQYPKNDQHPNIEYDLISKNHYCIDLIYNPSKTLFLKKSEEKGAKIRNGKKMLFTQAEASWRIWQNLIKKHNV